MVAARGALLLPERPRNRVLGGSTGCRSVTAKRRDHRARHPTASTPRHTEDTNEQGACPKGRIVLPSSLSLVATHPCVTLAEGAWPDSDRFPTSPLPHFPTSPLPHFPTHAVR